MEAKKILLPIVHRGLLEGFSTNHQNKAIDFLLENPQSVNPNLIGSAHQASTQPTNLNQQQTNNMYGVQRFL